MSVYIFVGPTLPVAEARKLLDAHYLPPVAVGDVYNLIDKKPRAIGIIDGLFERTPAVWHKEILFALSRGVRVLGSSSMGALRAAELHTFGMEGVGEIFKALASGELNDDDEVAITHGSAQDGYRALSDALVNIRLGLRLAEENQILSAASHRILLDAAKQLFYPERSWCAVCEEGRRLGVPSHELEALADFVKAARPDQKRADAVALLQHIARQDAIGIAPHRASFQFEPTLFWGHMTTMASRMVRAQQPDGEADVSFERVRNHVRVATPDRKVVQRTALLLYLVQGEAKRLGLTIDKQALAVTRFRRQRRLLSADAMNRWMERNRLTKQECTELVEFEALCEALSVRYANAIDGMLPQVLQLQGTFGDVLEHVEHKWRFLQDSGLTNPTLADVGISMEALLEWYQSRFGVLHTDLETHAKEWGFSNQRQFLIEMFAEYIYAEKKEV